MSEKPGYKYEDVLKRDVLFMNDTWINIARMTGGIIPENAEQYYITTNYKMNEKIIRNRGFSIQKEGILPLITKVQGIVSDELQSLADTGKPIKRPEITDANPYEYDETARIHLGHLSNTWLSISRMSGKIIPKSDCQFYFTTIFMDNGAERRNTGFSLQLQDMIELIQVLLEIRLK